MSTFGERLQEARKESGLTQKAVAKRIGMSQPVLSELENNEYSVSGFTVQLAHLYKVSARWLAEGLGPKELPSSETMIGDATSGLTPDEKSLLEAFRSLGPTERGYLLEDAKKYSTRRK